MAKITWTMENSNGTVTHTVNLSEANMTRVVDLFRSYRPQLSPADAVKAWMVGEVQKIKDEVRNHEGAVVAQIARDDVSDLE